MGVISSLGSAPGEPRVDDRTCTLCGACADTCPTGVLPEGHKPAIVLILGYPATTFLKAVRRPFLMVQGLDGR